MSIVVLAVIIYAIYRGAQNVPSAAQKELTERSAESMQRVVMWAVAAIVLLSLLSALGGQ